ncbi:hypothetical protein [Frateuria defendens]|uniref:hypothetical protein n=1 Tax=Frateuria defendens TaxID=2219559 RepID=UPI00069D1F57|nr:hypothetical protein [Frateuria defendens]
MTTEPGLITAIHTLLSFLALLSGGVVVAGLLGGSASRTWVRGFWITAVATSVTGFFFPFHGVTPAIIVGIIALAILGAVLAAARGAGGTRLGFAVYAAGLVASEYLLVFVAVAQAFGKIPALHALAPTQKEPPFAVAQLCVLVLFIVMGVIATRRTRSAVLAL